jgi:hypothetical protein
MQRRMIRVGTMTALALGGMALVAPPVTAGDSASEQTTTITIRVAGCEGCTLSAWTPSPSAVDDGGPAAKAKVTNGVAVMRLPTAQTRGASFQIDPVQDPFMDAVTLVVFRYQGAEVGDEVTKAQGRTYRKGSACWAGTSKPTAQFDVRVRSVWGPAFDPLATDPPTRARQPVAWVVPTQPSSAPYWPLFKGALQAQNTPACRF